MLINAWISSIIPFNRANHRQQTLAVASTQQSGTLAAHERFESEIVFDERRSPEPQVAHRAETGTRLVWLVPAAIFGCMAALAVFAWLVSWLDKR